MHVPTLPRELCDWSCVCWTFFSVLHLYAFLHFPADLLLLHRSLRFFLSLYLAIRFHPDAAPLGRKKMAASPPPYQDV